MYVHIYIYIYIYIYMGAENCGASGEKPSEGLATLLIHSKTSDRQYDVFAVRLPLLLSYEILLLYNNYRDVIVICVIRYHILCCYSYDC